MSTRKKSESVAVGVLFSTTGTTAVVERTQRNAVEMAVDEINERGGIAGRAIEAVFSDPASDPKRYRALAEEMIEQGVRIIAGCYMSSTRKAVLPVIEDNKAILLYPTLYEGFEFSPNCYYGGAAPNQNSIGLANYLMEHFGGSLYLVGSNYVFPYESNRIMRDFIVSNGGQVVQERYIPLVASEKDVARVIQEIKREKPAAIISTVVGDATSLLYRAYREAGFDPGAMPIGSLTTGEPEIAAMGAETAMGHLTSAPYFDTIRTPENKRFVAAYRLRYGKNSPISACTEAAYFQIHLLAQAIERADSIRSEDILQSLPGCAFLAPQGLVSVDPDNHHAFLTPRIGRAGRDGHFEIVETAEAPLKPDPYLITPMPTDWAQRDAVIG